MNHRQLEMYQSNRRTQLMSSFTLQRIRRVKYLGKTVRVKQEQTWWHSDRETNGNTTSFSNGIFYSIFHVKFSSALSLGFCLGEDKGAAELATVFFLLLLSVVILDC